MTADLQVDDFITSLHHPHWFGRVAGFKEPDKAEIGIIWLDRAPEPTQVFWHYNNQLDLVRVSDNEAILRLLTIDCLDV